MRYTDSKERSAELLRAALKHMGQHPAALNPMTFAVWYEYAAGMNTRLSQAIDVRLAGNLPLDDDAIASLYREYILDFDEIALQRASGDLQRIMANLVDRSAQTGDQAQAFGEHLQGFDRSLRSGLGTVPAPLISEALGRIAEMQDVTEALQQQVASGRHEIERLQGDLNRARVEALVDPLTRLLNRKGFDQKLDELLRHAATSGGACSVVMMDIDRFKSINDTYGHVMGDRVIQAVAETLRGTVFEPELGVARYGGEEFSLLLPQFDRAAALALAESCLRRIRAMRVPDRRSQNVVLSVTISAGVTSVLPGDDAASVLARADGALYAAKKAGRDRVHLA